MCLFILFMGTIINNGLPLNLKKKDTIENYLKIIKK